VLNRRLASKVAQASARAVLRIPPSAQFASSAAKLNNLSFRAKRELCAIARFSRDEIRFSLQAAPRAISRKLSPVTSDPSTFNFQLSTTPHAH